VGNQIPLRIRRTQDRENKGAHGQWRKAFCKKYTSALIKTRDNTHRSLLDSLLAQERSISCRKGCTHCCYHYVTVSLAQGIVIVDYLYKNKERLKQFLDNYQSWSKEGGIISGEIDRIRIRALSSSTPTQQILEDTRGLSSRYLDSHIRCPFLVDDHCSIYDVRPLSCSGHHAVSPPDWCAPHSQHKPEIHHPVPADQDLIEMIRLADSRLTLYELTLPGMVYALLTEGSSALMSKIAKYELA